MRTQRLVEVRHGPFFAGTICVRGVLVDSRALAQNIVASVNANGERSRASLSLPRDVVERVLVVCDHNACARHVDHQVHGTVEVELRGGARRMRRLIQL